MEAAAFSGFSSQLLDGRLALEKGKALPYPHAQRRRVVVVGERHRIDQDGHSSGGAAGGPCKSWRLGPRSATLKTASVLSLVQFCG